MKKEPVIVAVVGDPNSGKSVFLNLLYRDLIAKRLSVVMQEGDLTAPTQWWSLSIQGKIIRQNLKPTLSREKRLAWIINALERFRRTAGVDIVLVDVGGGLPHKGIRVTPENEAILKRCRYVVIVSRNDKGQISKWIKELKAKVKTVHILAILTSKLKCHSHFDTRTNTGVVCYLDRELLSSGQIPVDTLKAVNAVANIIARLRR